MFTAKQGIVITANFIRGFWLDYRNFLASPVLVDCHKYKIRTCNVEMRPGLRIFNPNLYTDFQRSVEGTVHARLQNQQIADMDGLNKVDVIHGGGNDMRSRMTVGRDCAGEVDEVHETSAQQI